AQGRVQDGAFLGDVYLFATEHRVEPLAQAGFLRELEQQLHGLVGDAVLGVVEEQADRLDGQALAAFRIGSEELPQMERLDFPAMRRKSLPRGTLSQWCHDYFPLSSQSRNPPMNALALSPARQPSGSFFNFLTLPPPNTTSVGSSAAVSCSTTSATCL